MSSTANDVSFFLNGRPVTITDPAPDLLLIDYLRSPDVALAGPKKPCGQGGCGGCTVILSRWNEKAKKPEHRAINSCLRPVCALGGLVVTTVEGTGAVRKPDPPHLLHSLTASRAAAPFDAPASPVLAKAHRGRGQEAPTRCAKRSRTARARKAAPAIVVKADVADHPSEHSHAGMNPVAHRLALNNGSQCGYCSVGFVMNMSEFITNHPKATKKEIEEAFDGNLCRCTGYRAILTGMKTFASDWTRRTRGTGCRASKTRAAPRSCPADVEIPFPPEARGPAAAGVGAGRRPGMAHADHARRARARFCTPTASGQSGSSTATPRTASTRTSIPATQLFVDIRLIPELHGAVRRQRRRARRRVGHDLQRAHRRCSPPR